VSPYISEKQPATIALPYPFNTLAVRVRLIKDDCGTLRKQTATHSRTPTLHHQNFERLMIAGGNHRTVCGPRYEK